ncbi:FtsK/SpoIIIE domain-containing protein [Streptomyces sp. NPDC007369]|uniref:FtsK/SpoIIIE domain-containing protein n=1 Tax=Streptomyces sp. NPDC007369 TaxID=3154589 RepID=UPI0033D7BC00
MQIRLTVLGSRSGHQTVPAGCDVLVTAPAGTALAAVASGLAATVGGPDTGGTVVLYAGTERLDPQRQVLGEPPLVDGAVLGLHAPVPDAAPDATDGAQLHVVAGPDAGGVHLLHPGAIRIGRSADADVPLDDPDVSRLHCAVTVAADGRVAVADLDSTNGTTVDGAEVGARPVPLAPGALLRIGESTLRLAVSSPTPLPVVPDHEGHLCLPPPAGAAGPASTARPAPAGPAGSDAPGTPGAAAPARSDTTAPGGSGRDSGPGAPGPARPGPASSGGAGAGLSPARPGTAHPAESGAGAPSATGTGTGTATGTAGSAPADHGPAWSGSPASAAPRPSAAAPARTAPAGPAGSTGSAEPPATAPNGTGTGTAGPAPAGSAPAHPGGIAPVCPVPPRPAAAPSAGGPAGPAPANSGPAWSGSPASAGPRPPAAGPTGTAPAGPGWSGVGGAGQHGAGGRPAADGQGGGSAAARHHGAATAPAQPAAHAPATAAGPSAAHAPAAPTPGPGAGWRGGFGAWARRWMRGGEEPAESAPAPAATAAVPDADDPAALLLAALAPTGRLWSRPRGRLDVGLGAGSRVALHEVGALGLAGPRARLSGVARSVVAQLAALHAPAQLEIVLVSSDRARPVAQRREEWGWLGWLPHVRPGHGQDCRLLLAYDRDQAAARTAELTRRLDEGALGVNWAAADHRAVRGAAAAYQGPHTLLIVDGDPGTSAVRDLTGRLASHGAAAGIHVLVLAETPAATPASPLSETYEAACAAVPAFRDCGAAAVLSGDVATTVRTFAVAGGAPCPPGTTAPADAVSAAWAERFARALAPLRAGTAGVPQQRSAAAALPPTARLLDELGLARATPASLMARWAAATEQGQGVGGLVEFVLGGGRGGPVGAELVQDGPHLLVEGPAGSGRTELLRSVAASLAAGARPDRLALVLLDGAGGERGDGLLPAADLPHVSAHLVAADPVRMREFAQALGAELKRRAELLDGVPFAEWHARREVSDRMVSPRRPAPAEQVGAEQVGGGDADQPRTGTLRLRAAAVRTDPSAGPSPLPRLVVLVDDLDALVAPGLGSAGRPAAGSVVRALEAVARDGERLGVHLVAATAHPDRTADTELVRSSPLRVVLDAPDRPGPGRGLLRFADGRTVPFQGGRVTGRIPRTATQRPTVVPVEWERMGDPPARRPVRELGNGPTDLALLASALDRASHLVSAVPVLFPAAP